MSKIKLTVIAVAALLMFPFPAAAADIAKIGVVDVQKILLTSSVGKLAKASMNKKAREMEANLNAQKEEIDKLKEELEREALVMSQEKREEREREIRIKINDIKSLKNRYEEELKAIEGKVVRRIQKDVDVIVQEMGKSEGYLLIISNPVVMYAPAAIDLTDELIERYNKVFAEQGGTIDIDKLE